MLIPFLWELDEMIDTVHTEAGASLYAKLRGCFTLTVKTGEWYQLTHLILGTKSE